MKITSAVLLILVSSVSSLEPASSRELSYPTPVPTPTDYDDYFDYAYNHDDDFNDKTFGPTPVPAPTVDDDYFGYDNNTPAPTPVPTPWPSTKDPTPWPSTKDPTPNPASTSKPTSARAGEDPHFQTWNRTKFDYHGECDLVLIDNPEFSNGLGMRLHIRTKRMKFFSYIEIIALQIGSDTLEFNNNIDNFLINGEKAAEIGNYISGFKVKRYSSALSVRLDKKSRGNCNAHIDFFYFKNGFPSVKPDGKGTNLFEGSLGMLGEWGTGKMIGRDGVTEITDATEFALQWQVRNTEPMLFSSARFPQFPSVCTPPNKMLGKRLGDSHMRKAAENTCAAAGEDIEECIFDVMATRTMDSAENIGMGGALTY